MGGLTGLLGIDWGTHSSKWLWKTVEDDGSVREGLGNILRSDVILDGDNLTLSHSETLPPEGTLFKSSLKGRLIQNPDGPFWEGRLTKIHMSLGELVTYSLSRLVGECYDNLVEQSGTRPDRFEVRFSLPNWVEGQESAEARARYEQAARVACSLLSLDKERCRLSVNTIAWHDLVTRALADLNISDNDSLVDYEEDGFRRVLEQVFTVSEQLTFRFVAESSAAGLAGLRKSGVLPPGFLRKILVADVGAGSTDIGYVIRSVNDTGREGLSQLPPASTCVTAGDDLTRRIVGIFREKGATMSISEAELIKVSPRTEEWVNHPSVGDWIDSIGLHIFEYVTSIPDKTWLPVLEPPLEVLVTGGSSSVPGLREALATRVGQALRSRFGAGSTQVLSLNLPRAYDGLDANRLAVALGLASEELPLLTYFRRLGRRHAQPTVTMPRSFA